MDAPPDVVWSYVRTVCKLLSLEVNTGNPSNRVLGLANVRLRRIAGTRPANFLECGSTITGPNANSYDVFFNRSAQVAAAENGSELRVTVDASARNPAHGGDTIPCTTTGRLEARFVEELRNLIG